MTSHQITTWETTDGSKTGFVPGVGEIVDGRIEGPDNLECPNLKKVEQVAPAAPPVSPPAPQQPNQTPLPKNEQIANNEETK